VALFTGDAVVVDEGHTYRGLGQIRAWREGPASKYHYTTQVSGTDRTRQDEYLVTGSLRALAADPRVALTIDDNTWPHKVLLVRGQASVELLDDIGPEYERAAPGISGRSKVQPG
jgi:hypothetical protein